MRSKKTGILIFLLFLSSFFIPMVRALDTLIINQSTYTYDESLKRIWTASGASSGIGETFTTPNDAYILTSVTFRLSKTSSPNGYLYAELYEITGSVGSSAVPTGSALASSDELLISSLSLSSVDINFAFNSSQQYTMSTNHNYYIGLHVKSGNVNGVNYVNVAANNSETAFYGNIAKWNSASWANMTASDLYFKVYGILAEKLTASNEGYTNNENGASSSFYSYWVRSGSINCSGYVLSLNYGSGYSNDTWTAFSGTNNVWANVSKVLTGSASQIGNTVYYKTYANASNGKWYVSAENSFVLQATITFQFRDVGKVEKNDVSISNGSVTYTAPATLKMDALPGSTYAFYYWNWTNSASSSIDNSLSFTVLNQTTLTCYFYPSLIIGGSGGFGGGSWVTETDILFYTLVGSVCALFVGFLFGRKKG